MLQRRTELVRRTPMPPPSKPMLRTQIRPRSARSSSTTSRTSGKKVTPASDIPTALRRLVIARDLGRCVRCGRHTAGIPRSIQHRQARGMGGRSGAHTAANLLLLCGTATTPEHCHSYVEDRRNWDEVSELGFAVSSFQLDPAAVPVLVQWLGLCWPGEEWLLTAACPTRKK